MGILSSIKCCRIKPRWSPAGGITNVTVAVAPINFKSDFRTPIYNPDPHEDKTISLPPIWFYSDQPALTSPVTAGYWVSPTGTATWANSYSATALSGTACASLSMANANAAAGNTVYLRGGTYGISINPSRSGTLANRITFKRYESETATFSVPEAGGRWSIKLTGRSYIVVDGITSYHSGCFFRIGYGSCYNEIKNCVCSDDLKVDYQQGLIINTASSGTVGLGSDHNWIHHNVFTGYGYISATWSATYGAWIFNDQGTIRVGGGATDPSTNNTVEDNWFSHGGHDCLAIFQPHTVIRRNHFHNDESYFQNTWGEPVSWQNSPASGYFGNRCIIFENSGSLTHTGIPLRCLVEGNRIGHSGTPPDDDGGNGIETTGIDNIIRHNYIYNIMSNGLYLKTQPDSAAYCPYEASDPAPHGYGEIYKSGSGTRAYQNTIYKSGGAEPDVSIGFKHGVMVAGMHGSIYPEESYCPHPGTPYDYATMWPFPEDVVFKDNIVCQSLAGSFSIATSAAGEVTNSNNYVGDDPVFVDADISDPDSLTLPDLKLQSSSPCINTGSYLTQASGAGIASVNLIVADAKYFQDGSWGSDLARGVNFFPDWIAIGTVSNIVEISSINYTTGAITLATPKTWLSGDPVWLYSNSSGERVLYGTAPNQGADQETK